MKMTKILSLVMALLMVAACLVACPSNEQKTTAPGVSSDVVHDITLWVSTTEGVKEFMEGQVEEFKALHPEYKFNITIESVGEGDAATEVLKDVSTAPDMYCFAQDQIARLVLGGALAPLGVKAAQTVTENNDAGSVNAATVGTSIYAYPLTSDNGYFLYYDSSIITDEQAKTLEGILAACKAADTCLGFDMAGTAFVTAGFFFSQPVGGGAPLCTSKWTYSDDGKVVTGVEDTFNSPGGLVAMKAMNELANSGAWIDQFNDAEGTGALITGIWAVDAVKGVYGDNMKATKLPTFTVDGQTYQMGSFSGFKFMGCTPQEDPAKAKLCSDLALYLTSEEAQLKRFYRFQWGPSNLNAQANENVQENALLAALLEQNAYSQPEGVIPSEWWTELAALGTKCTEANLTDADLQAALDSYEEKINAVVGK